LVCLLQDRRDGLHSDCLKDKPFVGEATLVAKVARSEEDGAASHFVSYIQLHDEDEDPDEEDDGNNEESYLNTVSAWLPILYAGIGYRFPHNERINVVGFSLDGKFVLAESSVRCHASAELVSSSAEWSSALLCDGGAHMRGFKANSTEDALTELASSFTIADKPSVLPERRLVDISTRYALGSKTILAIPIFPSDSPNGATSAAPHGYCYGKVRSDFGCTPSGVKKYISKVMRISARFYSKTSW
jgi:hypothetical protein